MDTWTNLCRCCLSPDSEVSFLDKTLNISEKFFETTSLEVKADDGLPQRLCINCYNVMNSAYQFRKHCIKMDTELKLQLTSLLVQAKEKDIVNMKSIKEEPKIVHLNMSDDPMKQLETIIKQEPLDDDEDDDCYYVVVIDDPKDKDETNDKDSEPLLSNIKKEQITNTDKAADTTPAVEVLEETPVTEQTLNGFNNLNSMDLFVMSNTKVPMNVPATILENEEESQENDGDFTFAMDLEEHPDNNSTNQCIPIIENSQTDNNEIVDAVTGNILNDLSNSKNIIKIMTTSTADGTILLKTPDGMEYLTAAELVPSNQSDSLDQEEVIFYEGDETSQYQILKCEGTELVIEYADDGQIATVIQQEDGSFVCDCGEKFEDLAEYEKHQFKHNPAGEHLCNLCGKGFESAEILTGHMLLHKSTGLLITCPFCNQLIKRNALTQHIKYGHNNIKPRCSVCSKTFANPNNLKRHMMIHSGVREFECNICFKRFHQKITMQTHRLTHLNQCDKTFYKKLDLETTQESSDSSKSKETNMKEELMKTVKREVTTNLGKLLGYACSLCKKMFSVESALEQHVEKTHILDLLCSECGEVLPSKKEMQLHLTTHKNIKLKQVKPTNRFSCSICRKGCSSQAMLIMHERVHTNERPFPCQLCSLRFKTKTHLRTHQLTHTREKKFGCAVCMKFFALKGNLVVHLRTHTGERPYVCSLCGEAFIDSKYLKKHKLKKHAIDNVPWNQY